MSAADLIALDPDAAAYVQTLHEQGLAGALEACGIDPEWTLGIIEQAITTHLHVAA